MAEEPLLGFMAEGFVILFLISFCFFLYGLYRIAINLYGRKRRKKWIQLEL
jgi:hypothetical protein